MSAGFAPITIVVNSIDDTKMKRFTDSLSRSSAGATYPVIRISDAKSMAEGLNRGAQIAQTQFLVFCHDDIEFASPFPMRSIGNALQYYDAVGLAGTRRLVSGNWYDAGQPFIEGAVISPLGNSLELQIFGVSEASILPDIQAMDGILIACNRKAFERVGGFDEKTFTDWHGYDVDLTHRLYLAGGKLAIAADVLVYHASHPVGFSEEKVRLFEQTQSEIEKKYLNGERNIGRQRIHKNIIVSSIDEALIKWRLERFGRLDQIET